MNLRECREELEKKIFSKYAKLSCESEGRVRPEDECDIRPSFQRDRDRIIHSKAFRRMKHKTQVFIAPDGDHFRTRLTHTLEVSQIARTICRALRLNEDLVEAISLGHDLGHTPFGHAGESALDELNTLRGFRHNVQSMRVVDFLERKKDKIGLNLTFEVRDGILNHSGKNEAKTLEGRIVKFADRIAYINHDIDDSIRAGVLSERELPAEAIKILGESHSDRINRMISDVVYTSMDRAYIKMSEEVQYATDILRDFMFDRVYLNDYALNEKKKVVNLVTNLYRYYIEEMNRIPQSHLSMYEGLDEDSELIVSDYIAGMTDRFAINKWKELFAPRSWSIF